MRAGSSINPLELVALERGITAKLVTQTLCMSNLEVSALHPSFPIHFIYHLPHPFTGAYDDSGIYRSVRIVTEIPRLS